MGAGIADRVAAAAVCWARSVFGRRLSSRKLAFALTSLSAVAPAPLPACAVLPAVGAGHERVSGWHAAAHRQGPLPPKGFRDRAAQVGSGWSVWWVLVGAGGWWALCTVPLRMHPCIAPVACTGTDTRINPHSNMTPLLPPLCRYINDYVLCSSCKSVDTLLDRDSSTRIMFLRCQQCSASRTVAGEWGWLPWLLRLPWLPQCALRQLLPLAGIALLCSGGWCRPPAGWWLVVSALALPALDAPAPAPAPACSHQDGLPGAHCVAQEPADRLGRPARPGPPARSQQPLRSAAGCGRLVGGPHCFLLKFAPLHVLKALYCAVRPAVSVASCSSNVSSQSVLL